jgi:hypothetical protein
MNQITSTSQLRSHVDEDCSYYLTCSECETVSESWHNKDIAAIRCYEAGWRMRGTRVICAGCVGKDAGKHHANPSSR